jgi:two-component system sensor histidine kinase YesM
LERRQAEINALQSQINPHFLYNLLESIRMRSVLKKEAETARIIKYVSRMFRRLLMWDDEMITIKEELNYIEEFLEVQKYRFGDKLTYDISVDNAVNGIKIPKMIYQPIVENACKHGLEKTKNGGYVSVSVKLSDNSIICNICDNGVGISAERLRVVNGDLHGESSGNESIGIKNVYKRLNLIYGDKSQLKIESVEGEGTSVFVSIPAGV